MARYLPAIARYAIYALLIFTPLARASVQPWAVTIIHMITLVGLCAFLLHKSWTRDWHWTKTPLDKPFILLLILCVLSTAFSVHAYTSVWALILLINYMIVFYLVINLFHTRAHLRELVYVIIGMAAFLSIFGLFKWFGANPFPWWDYTDLDRNAYRLTATFGNPDHLAGYMEMALPLTLGVLLMGFSRGRKFLILYLGVLIVSALILSLSRGGWAGIAVGLGFMALCLLLDPYFRRKGLVLALTGGTVAVLLIVLSTTPVVERILTVVEKSPQANMASRIQVWDETIVMIKDHPMLGIGPGTYAYAFTRYQPPGLTQHYTMAHNDYLHFISEIGLGLIAVIVWMTIVLYRKGFRKLKNQSRLVRGTTLGALSGITAILVHSIGDFNLHIPANAILFVALTAIVASPLPKPYDQ